MTVSNILKISLENTILKINQKTRLSPLALENFNINPKLTLKNGLSWGFNRSLKGNAIVFAQKNGKFSRVATSDS